MSNTINKMKYALPILASMALPASVHADPPKPTNTSVKTTRVEDDPIIKSLNKVVEKSNKKLEESNKKLQDHYKALKEQKEKSALLHAKIKEGKRVGDELGALTGPIETADAIARGKDEKSIAAREARVFEIFRPYAVKYGRTIGTELSDVDNKELKNALEDSVGEGIMAKPTAGKIVNLMDREEAKAKEEAKTKTKTKTALGSTSPSSEAKTARKASAVSRLKATWNAKRAAKASKASAIRTEDKRVAANPKAGPVKTDKKTAELALNKK